MDGGIEAVSAIGLPPNKYFKLLNAGQSVHELNSLRWALTNACCVSQSI